VLNRVEIAGTLAKDAELTDTPAGALRAEATVILKDVRYDRATNTDVVETAFVRVSAWEDAAETLGPLSKGTVVHILGQLTQQEVREGGKTDRKTRIRALVVDVVRRPREPRPGPPGDDTFPA
jgi:single-stranded DNA-binding protein